MIAFGRDVCASFEHATSREWLETNGIGGFSSSTIAGVNTRRYHGLLVAATVPPVGRMVLLSRLEEQLVASGRTFELAANQYPGAIHPQGYRLLTGFRLNPFPTWTYALGDRTLEKSVFMLHGENAVAVRYELMPDAAGASTAVTMELRPMLAFRDYHALVHEHGGIDGAVVADAVSLRVRPYPGLPALHISHGGGDVRLSGHWYRRFEYERERERGLDFVEDLFNPCVLSLELRSGVPVTIVASTEPVDRPRADAAYAAERTRRAAIVARSPAPDDFAVTLTAAADQFIVARPPHSSVIAGYHWFSDWGRDALIALPGLTLATGGIDEARRILTAFLAHVDRGMIPNRFPDAGEAPEYTAMDATLWLFQAVQRFADSGGDDRFIRAQVYEVLVDIIDWHVRGTRHGIRVDADGLLTSGPSDSALTWMDVRFEGAPVTPRFGKPVEVQALWYNALVIARDLAGRYGDRAAHLRFERLADRARRAFVRQFWNEERACLFDVVDGDRRDPSIRPNQVIALGLHHTMVSRARAIKILDVVERLLLTPYGLRTLAPDDPRYRGRYEGDVASRDTAYHQGTVWPWLMGPFATAYLRVHNTRRARRTVAGWLRPFADHLTQAGLGQISEVFDGDPPHRPGGCIAQAWSVAELLRVVSLARSS